MSKKSRKYRFVKSFLENKDESDSDNLGDNSAEESNLLLSDHASFNNELNAQDPNSAIISDSSLSDSALSFLFQKSDTSSTKTLELHNDCKSDILEHQNQNLIKDDLKCWALTHNLKHKQLSSLLSILKPHHPDLPLDSRTLLGSERSLGITPMQSQNGTNGEYIYFGIQQNLERQLFTESLNNILKEQNITSIELKCNIDGLKIYKSTNIDFWPILAAVHVPNLNSEPFVVAIYAGDSKPKFLDIYLKDFIQEIQQLSVTGLTGPDSQSYTLSLKCLVCDAPARAFLKNVKSHNGYYACERCNVKGVKSNGRFIYKFSDNEERRSHVSFINKIHAGHHLGSTPLVPTSWAINKNKDMYLWPKKLSETQTKKLRDSCSKPSINMEYVEWAGICKATVYKLEDAQKLAEKAAYTSNLSSASEHVDNVMDSDEGDKSDDNLETIRDKLKNKTLNRDLAVNVSRRFCTDDSSPRTPTGFRGFSSSSQSKMTQSSAVNSNMARGKIINEDSDDLRSADIKKITKALAGIKYDIREIKMDISDIKIKLNMLNEHRPKSFTLNSNFKLPLTTSEELQELEDKIENATHLQDLVNVLSHVDAIKKNVHFMMKKLMDRELSLKYSAKGKKQKLFKTFQSYAYIKLF